MLIALCSKNAGRRELGATAIGGTLASTLLAVLFVPVFFVPTQGLSEWWQNPTSRKSSISRALSVSRIIGMTTGMR
jgi:hypothetical protein